MPNLLANIFKSLLHTVVTLDLTNKGFIGELLFKIQFVESEEHEVCVCMCVCSPLILCSLVHTCTIVYESRPSQSSHHSFSYLKFFMGLAFEF